MLVEASAAVLPTGDKASTLARHLLRWMADPVVGVSEVARRHLARALAHEAFHAARFRQLPPERDGGCWENVAIAEGLATAFARDHFGPTSRGWPTRRTWSRAGLPNFSLNRSSSSRYAIGSSTTLTAAPSSPSVSAPGWSTWRVPTPGGLPQTSSGCQHTRY